MERARNSRWGRRIARWPSAAVVGASVLLRTTRRSDARAQPA
ncbi:MAG TPA: hypothetical protein VF250_07590 [Conexibacter sp.]